jgi:hypothetical protein
VLGGSLLLASILYSAIIRNNAAAMSLLAIVAPGQERDPAPNDRWGVLDDGFSVYSEGDSDELGGSSQRSGLNVAASGPQ